MHIWFFGKGPGLFGQKVAPWKASCQSQFAPNPIYVMSVPSYSLKILHVFAGRQPLHRQLCVWSLYVYRRGFDPELTGFLNRQTWQFVFVSWWIGLFKCVKVLKIWSYCECGFRMGTHSKNSTKHTPFGSINYFFGLNTIITFHIFFNHGSFIFVPVRKCK